ncbi:ISNCY family transposase [Granulicella tundricola]|uniref:Integrase catalytic region n=1 Tax=Granulicella tundricola (strain ATCC BAA-1859 / DSM 23138 / MP5ACTX9) TaxID=1198114 RepID=E8X7J9_GRATM|nr:ISNCY family transposase [Granulicella tundricola]ADW71433.1 Integrase catalytic region [Granulicella tundricola MP5ACTX9]
MSKQELRRVEVLTEVLAGRRTTESAAGVLGVSLRQAQRLAVRYRNGGGGALIHRSRGRPASNKLGAGVRELVLELIRQNYRDFGPTFAAEMLQERHGIEVSRETLRKWMVGAGVWLSRKQRRSFHQPRLRRESLGELVQIDGSEHRWFEQRGEPCTLLVFIDDATSRLMQMRFVPSESTASYFEALDGYLKSYGYPVAFYSYKHSVFRVNKPEAKGGAGMTQFGRALAELNIEIICAKSSHAKGRVERANRTLQDRLVKELRLDNVCDLEAGNASSRRSSLASATDSLSLPQPLPICTRRLNLPANRMTDILCHREQRHVGDQLTLAYDRKQFILERNEVSEELGGRYVDLYHFSDGHLEVRSNGHVLPYRVFDKDQRVSPAAVVENKRLGHALSLIKARQDAKQLTKFQTNSEKNGYRKKGRTIAGAPSATRAAMEMWKSPKNGDSTHPHSTTAISYNDKTALQIQRRYRFAPTA